MEKVSPWFGKPSDRGRLKNKTEQMSKGKATLRIDMSHMLAVTDDV